MYFDIEVITKEKGSVRDTSAACYGFCSRAIRDSKEPVTIINRLRNYSSKQAEYVSSIMNDLGLSIFFSEDEVSQAVSTGVIQYSNTDHYIQMLAIMTPFRYIEEYPKHALLYLRLVGQGVSPILAFAGIHYVRDNDIPTMGLGHSCFDPHKNVDKQHLEGYLERLADKTETNATVHSRWNPKNAEIDMFQRTEQRDAHLLKTTSQEKLESILLRPEYMTQGPKPVITHVLNSEGCTL